MIHGETGPTMANTKSLISELDDGSAVFLIHVDLRFPALFDRVQSWINDRNRIVAERQESDGNQSATIGGAATGNVFLAKFRYRGMWGHISLVWMQLSGFWELHDLAEWDYVINLSAHDFPLRRSREIHRLLSKEENRGRNFIRHWSEPGKTFNIFSLNAGLIRRPVQYKRRCACTARTCPGRIDPVSSFL
ncbi:hypothetical protein DFJ73DRAFT_404479 [Zopfochytrium polystomum]|nr:hypothetical protein DFJ73DRAFT_404479 [Zopfochytrium polystomum]